MAAIGAVVDGKYEILKQIGKGGMSVVYLAMDNRLNKQWAVKEIQKSGNGANDEVVVNSLLAEANLMKKLDHPSLPRIVDIIDYGETIYIVMDYIEGESLDKVLTEYGAQPEEIVMEWAKQICDAFDYLHKQRPPIIYRDMKPANIMLKPEGNLKVIDFGIAREYKELSLADTTVLGTKGYASPEHYGARQTDVRSDIFTLGMTLHHLLTGLDPRMPGYQYASLRQINPEISDGLEVIIDKCTSLDPDARYQNCTELMYDLEHPDLITKGFKKQQKRKLWLFLGSTILMFIMLVSGIVCRMLGTNINNSNYDILVSVMASTSMEEKIESYKQAIEIYPENTEGYLRILEAYETEGRFGKQKNDEFLAIYNLHKDSFDKSSVSVAELNYKIGTMYFNYYTNEDGTYSFSNRVQKAYPFFQANFENENIVDTFSNKELSDCYYQVCNFYKKYILNSSNVEEASRDNFVSLFQEIEVSLETISQAGAYDQLSLYNGTFMLLYDQREIMESVNVEEEMVLSLFEIVSERASDLIVQKEQSKDLQNEIAGHYVEYKEAIERTYQNAEERK